METCSVTTNGVSTGIEPNYILANLSWVLYKVFGKPNTLWYNNLFEPCGMHTAGS